ncbi:tetratricopeptide repeat protein [Limnospira fusiformis]|uniref:tetratricopeptide repeat protein n=1 Tax=Limnospira fusiformis TaxID=54297 RepID=UPI002AA22BD0|nr:LamG-like jellyroll fold domain-containing protein [Limnospira fusiformis LS22]
MVSDLVRGNQLLRSGKLEEAVAAFKKAIAHYPHFHWSHYKLGKALDKLDRLQEAVTAYRQAVALNPEVKWFHFSLGVVLSKQQQWEDAVKSYQQALDLGLYDPQFFYELGRALASINHWEDAVNDSNKDAVNNSNKSVAFFTYYANFDDDFSRVLDKQGNHKYAVAEYQKAFSLGWDRQVRDRLGYALTKKFQNNYLLDFEPNKKAYVEIPHSESLSITGDITIEFWLYIREWSATWTGILTKYITDRNNEFCLRTKNQDVGQWYYGDGNKYMIVGWIPKDEIELNEWTHVACVRKIGEYGKVFVNGVPWYHQDWTDQPKAVKTQSSVVLMGTPSLQSFQNGKMCDLRIWSIARTQDEILADLDKEITGSEPGLVWHWKFNESLKAFANDEKSKGKIFNATLVKTEKSGDGRKIEKAIQACRYKYASQRMYDDIWISLNQPVVNLYTNNDLPQKIELRIAEKYFKANTKFSLIDMDSLESLETIQCLEKLGIEDISQFCKNLKKIVSYQDNKNRDIYEFKLNAVKNGYLESICPWSGEILKSCQSFIVSADSSMSVFAYRFTSKYTFYLFVGGGHDWKMSIYFPYKELIAIIRIGEKSIVEKLCLQLKSYAVANWLDFKYYVSDDNKYKDLVATTGIGVHLGHTVLNEYSSYYQLFENNLAENFKKILIGPFEYIPFERLFPEIDRGKIVRKPEYSSLEMFTFCMKSNYFLIRPSNCEYNLSTKMATRIYDASVSSCSHTCLQDIEAAKKNFPLLWFEIKSNRRIWLNQAEAIAEIANRLHSDYPKLGIIFAGWSFGNQDNLRDRLFIEKDKQVIQQSRLLLNPEIPTFTVVGYRTYEKIAWAGAANIHIATYGSGCNFASIASKRLIVHANKGWYPARIMKAAICTNTPLSQEAISVIPVKYIVDEKPEMHHYGRNYYCNWEGIYHEIVKLLNTLNPKA